MLIFDWLDAFIGLMKGILKSPVQIKQQSFVPDFFYDDTGARVVGRRMERESLHYESMVEEFNERLLHQRFESFVKQQKKKLIWHATEEKYPDWDNDVMAHLSRLFAIFDREDVGLIKRNAFFMILADFEDETPPEARKHFFDRYDTDFDNCISYDEFCDLLYNITSSKDGMGKERLTQRILSLSKSAKFLNKLSTSERVEYGLC